MDHQCQPYSKLEQPCRMMWSNQFRQNYFAYILYIYCNSCVESRIARTMLHNPDTNISLFTSFEDYQTFTKGTAYRSIYHHFQNVRPRNWQTNYDPDFCQKPLDISNNQHQMAQIMISKKDSSNVISIDFEIPTPKRKTFYLSHNQYMKPVATGHFPK